MTKTILEPFVTPGELLTYRLVASNAGPSNALAVTVTDRLPAQLTFVSSPDGCSAAGQTVFCPTIAALASTTADPVTSNDTATVTPVVGPPRTVFAIQKSSAPNPHVPGLALTYTVSVTNDGPSLAAGAPLAWRRLPAGPPMAPTPSRASPAT